MHDIDNNFNSTLDSKISISREEIQHHIKSLSMQGIAQSPDFLMNEHIIFCGDKIVDELCFLFNTILRHAHVSEMSMLVKLYHFKGQNKDKSNSTTNRLKHLVNCLRRLLSHI